MIRQAVLQLFPGYTSDLEAVYPSMYSDVKRWVTTAVGVKIDPVEQALALEWWIGDRRATEQEVRNDWNAIKSRALAMTDADLRHWTARMQAPLTSVRLQADYVSALTLKRLRGNFDYIEKHLMPKLGEFPADAQLGIASLSWAIGAGFDKADPPRPAFVAACNEGDWISAMVHARLREEGNQGVVARNRQQDICFSNAMTVRERGLDPNGLWWPRIAPKDDSLHTVAVKALDLGIARETGFPPKDES